MVTNLGITIIRFIDNFNGNEIQTFGIPGANFSANIFVPVAGELVNLGGLLYRVKSITRTYPTFASGNESLHISVKVERY